MGGLSEVKLRFGSNAPFSCRLLVFIDADCIALPIAASSIVETLHRQPEGQPCELRWDGKHRAANLRWSAHRVASPLAESIRNPRTDRVAGQINRASAVAQVRLVLSR